MRQNRSQLGLLMAMLLLVAGERTGLVITKKAPTRGISALQSHMCPGLHTWDDR